MQISKTKVAAKITRRTVYLAIILEGIYVVNKIIFLWFKLFLYYWFKLEEYVFTHKYFWAFNDHRPSWSQLTSCMLGDLMLFISQEPSRCWSGDDGPGLCLMLVSLPRFILLLWYLSCASHFLYQLFHSSGGCYGDYYNEHDVSFVIFLIIHLRKPVSIIHLTVLYQRARKKG